MTQSVGSFLKEQIKGTVSEYKFAVTELYGVAITVQGLGILISACCLNYVRTSETNSLHSKKVSSEALEIGLAITASGLIKITGLSLTCISYLCNCSKKEEKQDSAPC